MKASLSRRSVLLRATYVTAGAVVGSQLFLSPGYAAGRPDLDKIRKALRRAQEHARERRERVLSGIRSKNGWEMEKVVDDRGNIYTRPVPGTPVEVQIRMGDVETVLVHVIRRFHYEVDILLQGEVVGWRPPRTVRRKFAESNQASGTAVQIRPGHYPAGVRGGFFPQQQVVIRDILAELDGVVRWGGDDRSSDESLFYVDTKPGSSRLVQVAEKIQEINEAPGKGAGTAVDVFATARRRRAEKLARVQRVRG
ncbi:hypothetical protein [Spirillospora sp. CA-294931]|uniref:hypothetical protein n=1 Tax=Spirillospora sp. CA-294931 TaxID=3240042 RepID=UPI003D8D9232